MPKDDAQKAREIAAAASQLVRDLRRMLGKAMEAEQRALKMAREGERT